MSAFFDELHERYGKPATFVRKLRKRMLLHGVSQAKLAERAGFQPIRLSEWVNERVTPSIESMAILDEAMEALTQGE